MKWPTFTDATPNESYGFTSRPHDAGPVRLLIIIGIVFMTGFLWVYFQPVNRGYPLLFRLLTVSVLLKLFRLLHEWYHYWQVVPPVRPPVTRRWTVDVMTTFCPGEPREMVVNTLRAIQAMPCPHTTYLCDEADDAYLRQFCAEMGVRHVTRLDKTDAKAGNINHALRQATGEICLILDPDHVPVPDFLDQVLPYFENPAVGFVQCVQGYYNRKESLIACGAAEQTYHFYGPMMTCMSNYGTAQAIGANCTFRRAALDSIGGHAAGLSEDMHTAMHLHAGGWQSVYVPLPLSYGLVPTTLSAYYKQQLKWARGTLELLVTAYPTVFGRLTGRQRFHYLTMPLSYLLGVVQLIDLLIPILALVTMRLPVRLDLLVFATAYLPLLMTAFLIRQYAQRWLIEKQEAGFHLLGGVLSSGTWWVYTLGLIYTIFRVKVPYLPTPKNDAPRNNLLLCVPNGLMVLLTLGAIGYSVYHYGRFAMGNFFVQLMIGFGLVNVLILSLNILMGQERLLGAVYRWAGQLTTGQPVMRSMRQLICALRYGLYGRLRGAAVPLFGLVLLFTTAMIGFTYRQRTPDQPHHIRYATTQPFYYGIEPTGQALPVGRPNAPDPLIEPRHLSWQPARAVITDPGKIASPNGLPLLYLEPDLSELSQTGSRQTGSRQTGSCQTLTLFLQKMNQGRYDAVLTLFLRKLKRYPQPVLLSFAPRFDDPARPWGTADDASLNLYRQAWQHLVYLGQQVQATNVVWVWCPTKPTTIASFHPDAKYIDWLGIDIIDRPDMTADSAGHSFATLYQSLHNAVRLHTVYDIRQKPVFITQVGTIVAQEDQWNADAMATILDRYPEIRGVVFRGIRPAPAPKQND